MRGVQHGDDRGCIGRCGEASTVRPGECGGVQPDERRAERPAIQCPPRVRLRMRVVARDVPVQAVGGVAVLRVQVFAELLADAVVLEFGQDARVVDVQHRAPPAAQHHRMGRAAVCTHRPAIGFSDEDGRVAHQPCGGEVVISAIDGERRIARHERRTPLNFGKRRAIGERGFADDDVHTGSVLRRRRQMVRQPLHE